MSTEQQKGPRESRRWVVINPKNGCVCVPLDKLEGLLGEMHCLSVATYADGLDRFTYNEHGVVLELINEDMITQIRARERMSAANKKKDRVDGLFDTA